MSYAEVYVDIKTLDIGHPFDYKIPVELEKNISAGCIVTIPFGKRKETGYVVRIKDSTEVKEKDIKAVESVLVNIPVFDKKRLRLIFWMCAYYVQPFGKIIGYFLPSGKIKKIAKVLNDAKWITAGRAFKEINPSLKSSGIAKTKNASGELDTDKSQNPFISEIIDSSNDSKSRAFLLKGFPDNEKSNIFKILCSSVYRSGKRTIIISPEMAGVETIFDGLLKNTGFSICINDHKKSENEKIKDWIDILCGNYDVVLGARSALFLPVPDAGMIIIDDAHDASYKESTIVRYNAQDIAIKLSGILKIPCVFVTSIPSIAMNFRFENEDSFQSISYEQYILEEAKRQTGEEQYIKLQKNECLNFVNGQINNNCHKTVIDLKNIDGFKEDMQITNRLYMSINRELLKKNKVVIFINKRGYSSFMICKKCGSVPTCPYCNISYSFHSNIKKLVCHHCSSTLDFTGACNICGSKDITSRGEGIEKVEFKIKQRFKGTEVYRIDSDAVKKSNALKNIIEELKRPGPAIILGTQMVLKDMDIKNMSLAGIIDFDSLLHLPDFSVNERTCQLLFELESLLSCDTGSEFFIQTFNPGNFIIESFISGNYMQFYKKELENRKELGYPPFESYQYNSIRKK